MLVLAVILAIFVYGLVAATLGTILPNLSDRFGLRPSQNGSIAFALRLVLTDQLGIPHQDQPDLLAEAEAAFAPSQPKSSQLKSASKSKKTPPQVKAPKKTATKKQKAA